MNYKNRKIIEAAQQHGYTTVKELAFFIKKYKPSVQTNEHGKKFVALSLIPSF